MVNIYKVTYWAKSLFKGICLLGALAVTTAVYAQDEDEVITINATVTGNQEQPKVLYIVPWKQAEDKTILYQSLNTRLETVFGHVERREHLRQLELIGELNSTEDSVGTN